MSHAELVAQVKKLEAENAKLRADRSPGLSHKITEPRAPGTRDAADKGSAGGAIAVYGLGRFPVTLYAGQWLKLADYMPMILHTIEENKAKLSWKEKPAA